MGIVPFRQTAIKANKYSLSIWQPTSSSQLKSLDIMLLILCPSLTRGNTSQAPTHFATTSPTFSDFFPRSLWNSPVFPGVLDEQLPKTIPVQRWHPAALVNLGNRKNEGYTTKAMMLPWLRAYDNDYTKLWNAHRPQYRHTNTACSLHIYLVTWTHCNPTPFICTDDKLSNKDCGPVLKVRQRSIWHDPTKSGAIQINRTDNKLREHFAQTE